MLENIYDADKIHVSPGQSYTATVKQVSALMEQLSAEVEEGNLGYTDTSLLATTEAAKVQGAGWSMTVYTKKGATHKIYIDHLANFEKQAAVPDEFVAA